jgi:hypothetical protein
MHRPFQPNSAQPGGKDRRHPAALHGGPSKADRVDTAVYSVKLATTDPDPDGASPNPPRMKLPPRHKAVLILRQPPDHPID